MRVYLPSSNSARALGYTGIGGNFFQAIGNNLLVVTTTPLDGFDTICAPSGPFPTFIPWYGWRDVKMYQLNSGNISATYRFPEYAPSIGRESMVRYAPSGNYFTAYEFGRISRWDAGSNTLLNVANGFGRTDIISVNDEEQIGTEYAYHSTFQVPNSNVYYDVASLRLFHDRWSGNSLQNISQYQFLDASNKPVYGLVVGQGYGSTATDRASNRTRIDVSSNQRCLVVRSNRLQWDGNQASHAGVGASLWYRTDPNRWDAWVLRAEWLSSLNLPTGVYPTMVRFHPNSPFVLYIGLSDGSMRAYQIDADGQVLNLNNPTVFRPSLGPIGAVTVMDIAQFTINGINYTVMAIGGPTGLSIYTGSACRIDDFREAYYYDIDVGFPQSQNNSIWLQQPAPNADPIAIYGNGAVLTVAKLDNLPLINCPEDVDRNSIIDDADLLAVLFAFGEQCYCPADINCDGIVDDADLLLVLFRFGETCN
jgi:hypothetical protein